MPYCEVSEVREMIKDDVLSTLIGAEYIADAAERESRIAAFVQQAIADADAEIDGYLAVRYPVPLFPVPRVITKMSKDIAVYNVFSRKGIDEDGPDKNYLNRYRAAIDYFKLIAAGKVDLGTDGITSGAPGSSGFRMCSSPRRFSRDSMRGM